MARPRLYANQAERQAAYLARKQVRQVGVLLPLDVADALDAYIARQVDHSGMGKSDAIVKLLRTQLLRKR